MIQPARRVPRRAALALAAAAASWLIALGATWRGVTDPVLARISLLILGAGGVVWLAQRRGPLPRTVFDRILPIGLAALLISTAFNAERWPSILSGAWFVAGYVVVWYALQDALAGRLIAPQAIVTVLLLSGIPVLISALVDAVQPPPGRISGALENANALGGYLALLIPLLIARLIERPGPRRALYAVYLIGAASALLLTESRGALLSVVTALLVVGLLRIRRHAVRVVLIALFGAAVIGLIAVRGDTGRLPIYADVAAAIRERPLTGTGLFTFRLDPRALLPPSGVLPGGTHLYAHNLILHVAVELGLPGLIALALTGAVVLHHRPPPDDPPRLWAYVALIGAGAQQMVDFPLMMPGLALTALAVLSIALPPLARADRPARPIAALALLLWIVGMILAPLRAL
jgi:O-antigen ligase